MKRICIYLTYDKDGIIDAYIGYMMKELRTCVDYLAVVCNMPEVVKGMEHLERYADEIFFRENIGFDAGGFKDALCTYIGWERLKEYDELLLVNDSFFGPFVPMRRIVDEMDGREADFWGLTAHKDYISPDGKVFIPEHLQSFFLAFRSSMLCSEVFRNFWESMPYYGSFDEVIREYETKLTPLLHSHGYAYASYADTEANDTENIRNNFNQFIMIPNELVRKRRFPFLKRRQIARDALSQQTQENIPLVFDYIGHDTDYDINLIYENITRTMDISDLQRRLCLNFIAGKGQLGKVRQAWRDYRKALAVWVQHDNSYEDVMGHLKKLSEECAVFIFTESGICKGKYRSSGFPVFPSMQGEVAKSLAAYDYVCVLHDADMASDRQPSYIGKSDFYRIWENLLGGGESGYLADVVGIFEENPRLGILTIPHANFGPYFGSFGRGWDGHYEAVRKAAEKYGIPCRLDEGKPPFAMFENYWIRGELLVCLEDAEADFMEELPYLWPYIAQERGYLSGILESGAYAGMDAINLRCYLDCICAQIRHQFGEYKDMDGLRETLSKRAIADYCREHGTIYAYGTGKFAEKYGPYIPNVEAYVVTDGKEKKTEFLGKKVVYLSDITGQAGKGIIVCMDKIGRNQVIPLLEKAGFHDYLCV